MYRLRVHINSKPFGFEFYVYVSSTEFILSSMHTNKIQNFSSVVGVSNTLLAAPARLPVRVGELGVCVSNTLMAAPAELPRCESETTATVSVSVLGDDLGALSLAEKEEVREFSLGCLPPKIAYKMGGRGIVIGLHGEIALSPYVLGRIENVVVKSFIRNFSLSVLVPLFFYCHHAFSYNTFRRYYELITGVFRDYVWKGKNCEKLLFDWIRKNKQIYCAIYDICEGHLAMVKYIEKFHRVLEVDTTQGPALVVHDTTSTGLLPHNLYCGEATESYFNGVSGITLHPSFFDTFENSNIRGFLRFFTLSKVLPLVYFYYTCNRPLYNAYYSVLVEAYPAWRGPSCKKTLWPFLLSRPQFVDDLMVLSTVPDDQITRFRLFLDLFRETVGVVSDVQGPKEMLYKAGALFFEGIAEGAARWRNLAHIQRPFTHASFERGNPVQVGYYQRFVTENYTRMFLGVSGLMCNLIWLEGAIHCMAQKEYTRAFAQLWAFSVNAKIDIVAGLHLMIEGWVNTGDLRKAWENSPERWGDIFEEEVREVQGGDVVNIWNSSLWKKFSTFVGAILSANFIKVFPSSWHFVFFELEKFVSSLNGLTNVTESFIGFVTTLGKRMMEFLETWDWRVFLSDGGFDTWPERGFALLQISATKGSELYPTIIDLIKAYEDFIAEGDKYRLEDLKRVPDARRFTPPFEHVYSSVLSRLVRARAQYASTSQREREPWSAWMVGPAGIGKTTDVVELKDFHLRRFTNRELDADGNPITLGSDLYCARIHDKYWTNIGKPEVLCFNDVPGDGYINNGSTIHMADIMRLAVDKEPFYTPQADIADKFECVIDPSIVCVTSNATVFNFQCYGSDWKKLIRRYPNIFYKAYPVECYKVDITPNGSDDGELIDPKLHYQPWMEDKIRIYSMEMIHTSGRLTLKRTNLIGIGNHSLIVYMKRLYLQHRAGKAYVPPKGKDRCCMMTPLPYHAVKGKCMDDCDWEPSAVEEVQCFPKANDVVDGAVDRVVERFIDRRQSRLRKKFAAILFVISEHKASIAAALAVVGSTMLTVGLIVASRRETKPEVQAIVNPVKNEFTPVFLDRYGGKAAQAVEVPNPPKYPNTTRSYVTMSPASKTSAFEDVLKLVQSQTFRFRIPGSESFGTGCFISCEYMLLNTHTALAFKDKALELDKRESNDMYYPFRLDKIRTQGDICVAKVPTGPFRNLTSHLASSVGSIIPLTVFSTPCVSEKMIVDFNGKAGLKLVPVLVYAPTGVHGDCGYPGVGNVEGKGVIVSIHVAKLNDGKGAGLIIDRNVVMDLIRQHGVPITECVMNSCFEDVGPLHPASKLRAACDVSMSVIGTFERANRLSKSRLVPTELNELASSRLTTKMCVPLLHEDGRKVGDKWVAPYVHKFKGMSVKMGAFRTDELERALADYVDGMPVVPLSPLTLHQVINGVDGDPYLKKMNLKTSAGIFQRFYPDKSFLVNSTEISSDFLRLLEDYITLLEENVCPEHQKWCLKDELVSIEKESIKKYRYFMINDFLNLFAFRMFLSALVAHMYRNKEFFECFGAFNPASPEFGVMFLRLKKFGFLIMADLKHMDSSHRAIIVDYVADFFVALSKGCGYNVISQNVVRNLIRSIVFSIVELNGDLAFFTEGMGSGVYVTFIVNCLILSLLYRVAWFRISSATFRSCNALVAGGDDSSLGTNNLLMTGNHVLDTFRDYGYELSPPTDKNGSMLDFYSWEDFVFLKRVPKTVTYLGEEWIVGALSKDSIWKSLGWEIPSPDVTHLDRMAQVLDAAQREMALHGEDDFAEFLAVVKPFGLRFRNLGYQEILRRYAVGQFYDDLLEEWYLSPFEGSLVSLAVANQTSPVLEHSILGPRVVRSCTGGIIPNPGDLAEEGKSATKYQIVNSGRYIKINESASFIGNDSHVSKNEKTTTFDLSSNVTTSSSVPHVEPDYGSIKEPIDLPSTLSRPTFVGQFDWTPVTGAHTTLASLYAVWKADTFIASKLHGFKFFRGRPKLRLVTNGFSFYYGKLVAAVDLNPGADTWQGTFDPKLNTIQMKNVAQGLQAPHVSIDPSVSVTYDLELPFYSANGWYNLFEPTLAPEMYLHMFVQNPLLSANDVAPTSVNIKIYLLIEDVELSVPSVAAILGPKEDTPTGTISKPLLAISHAAGVLKNIPMLTEFAGPVEMVAGIGSRFASMLGYSKPVVLEESRPTLNLTVDQPTYTDGRASITKLTGDPKQEVAVTAYAATVGTDNDMLISDIVHRFGLVETLQWTSSGVTGTFPVNPTNDYPVTAPWIQLTPVGWVTSRFQYWTGGIIFRFEIVASGFHRGAIGISWIPYDDPPGGSVLNYPNKYMTKIIDLNQTKTVDFVVPFAGTYPVLTKSENNGVLRVYEINPLRSASSTPGAVSINVYMAAAEDFELFRPYVLPGEADMTYVDVAAVQGPEGPLESAELNDITSSGGEQNEVVRETIPNRPKIYFGESFTSIKQLCNRHCLYLSGYLHNAQAPGMRALAHYQRTFLPIEKSLMPATLNLQAMGSSFSAFFGPAFLAMRGGERFKFTIHSGADSDAPYGNFVPSCPITSYVRVSTVNTPSTLFQMTVSNVFDGLSRELWLKDVVSTNSGAMLESVWIHNSLEYEVPYLTRTRFINPRKILPLIKGKSLAESPRIIYEAGFPDEVLRYDLWHASGDDFSLHFFMFVPEIRICNQDA
jgi:hypothetical protein